MPTEALRPCETGTCNFINGLVHSDDETKVSFLVSCETAAQNVQERAVSIELEVTDCPYAALAARVTAHSLDRGEL